MPTLVAQKTIGYSECYSKNLGGVAKLSATYQAEAGAIPSCY